MPNSLNVAAHQFQRDLLMRLRAPREAGTVYVCNPFTWETDSTGLVQPRSKSPILKANLLGTSLAAAVNTPWPTVEVDVETVHLDPEDAPKAAIEIVAEIEARVDYIHRGSKKAPSPSGQHDRVQVAFSVAPRKPNKSTVTFPDPAFRKQVPVLVHAHRGHIELSIVCFVEKGDDLIVAPVTEDTRDRLLAAV